MSSPFSGMDPYIESQGYWEDFQSAFLGDCRKALTAVLPRNYGAFIEQRISLVDRSDEASQAYRPDIAVLRGDHGTIGSGRGALASLEPVAVPLATDALDEIRERWIEIKRLPDRSLVTVIEILSPTNKTGSGRIEYLEKRKQWIRQPVNVVEIDLLFGGHRLPMRGLLPTGDYYAFVSRSNRRPNCDVYAWSIRRELPAIPIPLSVPDPDVLLDLKAVFAQTYDGAPYGESINYSAPLDLPLASEDRAWAEQQARTGGMEPRAGT
jgi:Protein of unknown function (DUF4058)